MAILKIRDNEGVITNIAAIKGENGKSPIIKNGTWWTYDDDKGEYIDTGLGAEKETVLTKNNIEAVLTGTITSHNHDDVYIKDAPSDSKQYVRYNGEWNAIDLSSVNPYDASWVLNNTATQEQINELVDALNNKRRIIVEPIDPDVVVDGTDNIYIGITSQAENSFISIYIDKSTGNITYGYSMLPTLDDVESIKVRSIDHIPTEDDIEFEYLYSNKTMPCLSRRSRGRRRVGLGDIATALVFLLQPLEQFRESIPVDSSRSAAYGAENRACAKALLPCNRSAEACSGRRAESGADERLDSLILIAIPLSGALGGIDRLGLCLVDCLHDLAP